MPEPTSPLAFTCPSCGAPLTAPGDDSTFTTCPACNTTVEVPSELRARPANSGDSSAQKKAILHELMRLVGSGNKIGAIKLYRQAFNVGLAEAKNEIDALEAGQGIVLPEPVGEVSLEPKTARQTVRRSQPVKTNAKFSCGLWVFVVILFGVAGFIFFIVSQKSGGTGSLTAPGNASPTQSIPNIFVRPPTLLEPAVLAPVEDAPSDLIAQARNYETDPYTNSLARFSTSSGKILWLSQPFTSKDVYFDKVFTDGIRVFLTIKDDIYAYQTADGKALWQAKLSDKLGYCNGDDTCTLNYQSVVMLLTSDETLQALDATTGKTLWSTRVSNGSFVLRMYKDSVAVPMEDPKTKDDYLAFLDYKTGKEIMRVAPEQYYSYNPAFFSNDDLYLISSSVVEKWNLAENSPKLVWHSEETQYGSSDKGYLAKDALFLNTNNGLLSVNLTNGNIRLFLQNEDYDFNVLAEHGSQLIILARRTRGTEKFEIWPVDMQSGEVGSTIAMGEGKLYDGTYETISQAAQYAWTWQLYNDVLYIVKFQLSPNQVSIDSYNPKDWKKTSSQTIPLTKITDDSYGLRTIVGWQRKYLFVLLDTDPYGFDIEKGKIILTP